MRVEGEGGDEKGWKEGEVGGRRRGKGGCREVAGEKREEERKMGVLGIGWIYMSYQVRTNLLLKVVSFPENACLPHINNLESRVR